MHAEERVTFDASELAVVLSHYDLGVIESITDFPRGSRQSPKVGIVCEAGKFLLKRRSAARAHPDRVRFAHHVQQYLARAGFPFAKLVLTRNSSTTLVQIRGNVYELFEFVVGQSYQQTAVEARDAGMVLARFHKATEDFESAPSVPMLQGDYHDAPGVRTGLWRIAANLSSHDSFAGNEAELESLVQFLLGVYDRAAEAVNAEGLVSWPVRIAHCDWHPGNLLFRKQKVVAVVDFDSARGSRRVIDMANGALQFSIIAGGDPATWPDQPDEERFRAFLEGYESLIPLSMEERRCIPHLMPEALIAECVPPITETGSVGRWSGYRVLQMVRRKVAWLNAHRDRLTASTAS